tara:strand:- start:363 stop:2288 length:1926 start_codon:yes stop_codon:yes gene_type:complete
MSDLSAVVNQLRQNNDDARYGNLQLNQNVEESRKENSAGLQKLSESIIKNTASILKDVTVPIVKNAQQEQKDREEAELKKVETDKKGNVLLFANLAKQNKGLIKAFTGFTGLFQKNKAKEKADENRENRFLNAFKNGILSLNKKFNGFVKGIADSAKQKGKDVLEILKKFAIVGALGTLVAFLNSDMFKNMKEKFIDPLTESFGNLFSSLGKIGDGIDKLKSNFYNEETGEFQFIEGIRKSLVDLKNLFSDIGIALAVITGLVFRKKILAATARAVSGMTSMLGRMIFFNDQVADTNKKMKKKVDTSKKTGVFRKGIGGIAGRFGRLFSFFGRRAGLLGLIAGTGALMSDTLLNTKVFSSVGSAFKGLFSVVGDFSKKLLGIKDTATKDLKKTVDENDGKKKKKTGLSKEELDANKKRMDAQSKIRAADAKAVKLDAERKKKALEVENKKKLDAFKKADTESMKAFDKLPKKISLDSKKLATAVASATARFSAKMLPFFGAAFGIFETGRRLVGGDLVGAGLEFGGVFAPSATGLPVDASLAARDVYKQMFGSQYEADLKNNPAQAKSNMLQIKTAMLNAISSSKTASDGGGVTAADAGKGGAPIIVNNINNSKSSVDNSSQSVQSVPITDLGVHPEMLMR